MEGRALPFSSSYPQGLVYSRCSTNMYRLGLIIKNIGLKRHLIISRIHHYVNQNSKLTLMVILRSNVHCVITYIFKLFGIGEITLNNNILKLLEDLEITE